MTHARNETGAMPVPHQTHIDTPEVRKQGRSRGAQASIKEQYISAMSKNPNVWKNAFLAALREIPIVAFACRAVGIHRSTAYAARTADELFAQDWDHAIEDGVDRAEMEAFRRGVDGHLEPVICQGRVVLDESGKPLMTRKYSDALLALILKGRRKQVYSERLETTGPGGGPQQQLVIVTGVSREILAES